METYNSRWMLRSTWGHSGYLSTTGGNSQAAKKRQRHTVQDHPTPKPKKRYSVKHQLTDNDNIELKPALQELVLNLLSDRVETDIRLRSDFLSRHFLILFVSKGPMRCQVQFRGLAIERDYNELTVK